MRLFILSICFLLAFSTGNAQEKKKISHEDLWLLKRVGTPKLSPDGKWVVFNVTEPAYDEKEIVNDLWIVPADGSMAPRRITAGKSSEGGYQWSPDGKYIAFTARREGEEAAQIFLLNVKDGGEAQKLTSISTGVGSLQWGSDTKSIELQWSPDSKKLLFASRVYPGAYSDSANKRIAEEKKKNKYKARVYTHFPVRRWDQWVDEKQAHFFVQSVNSGSAKDIFSSVEISKTEGFNIVNASWSPDGNSIIFSATTDAGVAAYQEPVSNLYQVPVDGGDARQLTKDGSYYTDPQFTQDGKYLFCLSGAANNKQLYNLEYLTRFDWPSMQNRTFIAKALDRPVNNFELTGKSIFLSINDSANDKLYTVPVTGTNVKLLTKNGAGCFNAVTASGDGNVVIATYESAIMPPEIVRIKAGGDYTFLTNFNAEKLKALDLNPAEPVWFTSSRGKKIKSLLVKPAGFNSTNKYPLFVVIHGGPASSWKDNWGYRWNYHLLSSPGYVLLLTDYTGSIGYGEKFSQDIQFDPFKGPADEINEAADDAIKKFAFIDASKQVAGGASYGGHLSNWLQGTTTRYKALVSHAGLVNSEAQWGTSDAIYHREIMAGGPPWEQSKTWKDQNPIRLAANFKTPVLVTVGELDYRVPMNNALEYWSALKRMKVPGKLIVFPEASHWISKAEDSRFFYQELHNWFATYLK
jgi:dipeptidyl aminopeptidase/acylaminoacyl peptidase